MKRKKPSLRVSAIIFALLIAGVGTGLYFYQRRSSGPIPNEIVHRSGFPIYYPTVIRAGFVLQKDSVRDEGGILFYIMEKGGSTINVSEQAAPAVPPDFQKLEDALHFKKIDISSGSAVVGLNIDKPTAIMLTNTTLINIAAPKEIPTDTVIDLVKSMRPLER